ncbi:unnamed protein product [Pleuronectes platessa]|uniref:Tetraspanin n=1 Tax=Pleuronectes platessa TaxID=8262 RepID=A0A9N7VH27_PLEPL|nr:unnamed protein product [Pleuronectes platessa]
MVTSLHQLSAGLSWNRPSPSGHEQQALTVDLGDRAPVSGYSREGWEQMGQTGGRWRLCSCSVLQDRDCTESLLWEETLMYQIIDRGAGASETCIDGGAVCRVLDGAAVYMLLGAGGLMMVVGFFGCFGAVRESQCLLASFFACLLIIFGAEIAAGVFGFLNKEQIVEEVQKFYSSSITDTTNVNGTAIALIYHKTLNCCGGSMSDVSNDLCADASSDTQDCLNAITDFFNEKLHTIGYIGIGVAGVMIIGMIFSMVLCCAIRNSREVI